MTNNIAQYTMKVWLTSVLVSPVLFVLVLILKKVVDFSFLFNNFLEAIEGYIALVIGQIIFSILTWFIFWLMVEVLCRIRLRNQLRTVLVSVTAILLTVGTFLPVARSLGIANDGNGLINLMYANCAAMAWGVWYYKLDIKTKEQTAVAEEV